MSDEGKKNPFEDFINDESFDTSDLENDEQDMMSFLDETLPIDVSEEANNDTPNIMSKTEGLNAEAIEAINTTIHMLDRRFTYYDWIEGTPWQRFDPVQRYVIRVIAGLIFATTRVEKYMDAVALVSRAITLAVAATVNGRSHYRSDNASKSGIWKYKATVQEYDVFSRMAHAIDAEKHICFVNVSHAHQEMLTLAHTDEHELTAIERRVFTEVRRAVASKAELIEVSLI